MSASGLLLSTKLYIPPARPGLVPRLRLTARVSEGLTHPLTLISAPAGFGKTTLVSEWHTSDAGHGFPLAWLSLDEGDGDPARFFTYLIAALRQIDPAIGRGTQAMMQSPQPPPPEALLTSLINEIASVSSPFALVLDDYHLIDTPPVHQQLAFLLEHQPPQMHLVLITREDPLLPLSRLRARGQIVEIRQADLQFTTEETADFMRRVAQTELAPDDLAALQQRTEGWIAGLQLLALSLRGHADVKQWVESFTGSNRYVLDYLMDEVFQRQPADVQDFLLKTSILDRLTAPLCDAVVDRGNSRDMLCALEQANLFIIPLDQTREWYRYHHLFVDLLHHRLHVESGHTVNQLHRRASQWYAANGFRADAIRHALAASDWERAADLLLRIGSDMLKRGEVVTLLNWYRALPEDFVHARPRLCYEYSWPLILAAQLDPAEFCLQQAEQAAQNDPVFLGEIAAAQAYIARVRGNGRRVVELSQRALALLPQDDWGSRSIVAMNLGMTYWYVGHLAGAQQMLTEAREAAHRSENNYVEATANVFLCRIEAARGKLHRAADAYRQVIDESGQLPVAALGQVDLARLLYEWNDLEAAAHLAQGGIEFSRRSGNVEVLLASYRTLALIKQAQGDISAAQAAIQESSRLAEQPGLSPSAHWYALGYHALIALLGNDLDTAAQLIEQFPALDRVETLPDYLVLSSAQAQWLLRQGQRAACAELLTARHERITRAGVQNAIVETRALQALAAPTSDEALTFLSEALMLAEPEGYVRTFVDLGEPMATLLREAASQHIATEYIGKLLAAFRLAGYKGRAAPPRIQPLVEPLSERELEVLRRLAHSQTNQEIAQVLYVSANTVKAHLKSIYGKLGVNSRQQAITKARELGLLA